MPTSTARRWPWPVEPVRILAVALQFLTRIPVGPVPVGDGDLRRATAAFPLVGVVVGGAAAAVFAVTAVWLGTVVAAAAAVATAVAVTGAFHEDGLADTADGVWGGWDPARRLEIMRDPRVGTYGASALVLVLVMRVALLAGLTPADAARVLLLGHTVGRAAILVQIRALPAVRDQGHGARVAEPVGAGGALVAVVTVAGVGAVTLGVASLAPVAAALVGVAALRRLARRRLGGSTGDVLGATQQVALVLAAAAAVAVLNGGG